MRQAWMAAATQSRLGLIFERQWLHFIGPVVLISGCCWASRLRQLQVGELWGLTSIRWYWIAILIAVIHQLYTWLCWRFELHGRWLTGIFGWAAFPAFAFGFAIIGIARVIVVFVLAYANRDTLDVDPLPLKITAIVALIPALYLFYSVRRYFTFKRAFGADHFDPSARNLPFVREGSFRFTSNGMYTYGFLLFWVPALWWGSAAALAVALFNHLYIWVHYVVTERPDMRRIYADKS